MYVFVLENTWGFSIFCLVWHLQGWQRPLEPEDLASLPEELFTAKLYPIYEAEWQRQLVLAEKVTKRAGFSFLTDYKELISFLVLAMGQLAIGWCSKMQHWLIEALTEYCRQYVKLMMA